MECPVCSGECESGGILGRLEWFRCIDCGGWTADEVKKLEGVELIASGYEWTCPNCDYLNREIELTETVECGACRKVYEVTDHYDAIG